MSRVEWLRHFNQRIQKHNRKLVQCRANDPRWSRLGDYYLVDTKAMLIVRNRIKLAEFAPALTVAPSHVASPWVIADVVKRKGGR
jgi:hypothetical protein